MQIFNKIKNGWIFSKKEDLMVFYFPFLPSILIGILVIVFDLEFNSFVRTSLILDFIISAFLDYPHALSTIYRPMIADQDEMKRRKILFLLMPLILFIIVNIWDSIDKVSMLLIITYINIFHLIRQQWGWMTISDRKIKYFNKIDRYLSKIFLYIFTLGPILWWHSQDLAENIGFTAANDLPKFFSLETGEYIKYTVFISFALFLIYNLYKLLFEKVYNFNKFLILFSTWFAWTIGIIVLKGEVVFIDLSHAIPYLYLMFFYCKRIIAHNRKKKKEEEAKTGIKAKERSILDFIQDQFFNKKYSVIIFMLYLIIPSLISLYSKVDMIEKIFLSLALFHYISDGFIWRKSKKENVESLKNGIDV